VPHETPTPVGFEQFLAAAKRATYAAQGDSASVPPLLLDSKQLEYREADFFYRDVYVGMTRFVGQEIVYFAGRALWSMSYSGGLCSGVEKSAIRPVYLFLRQALTAVPDHLPLRGPALFDQGTLRYTLHCNGNLEQFDGIEEIHSDGRLMYRLHFAGGRLA
jgi:hypothetical protein